MKKRAVALILLGSLGCGSPYFVADGPLKRSLTEFDRIDVRPLADKTIRKAAAAPEATPLADSFLKAFRQDMTNRLHRKRVLNLPTGPMVTLEGMLLRYECEDRVVSYARDNFDNNGIIEIEVVLKDEKGTRIGGGKAAVSCASTTPEGAMRGAEKRAVAAIGDFLRKQVRRGSEPAIPDPDDEP